MKQLLFILIALCFFTQVHAQKKLTYTGSLEGGLLKGDVPGSSGFVSLTSGVAYKKFSLVLGGGYDSYRFGSLPLFAEVKKTFTQKNWQPFVQFAVGINVDALSDNDKEKEYNYGGKYADGFYTKLGGGVVLKTKDHLKVLVNAGYSYKTTNYEYSFTGIQPYESNYSKTNYHLNRWYFGVGFMW